jgi:hypothetical protein
MSNVATLVSNASRVTDIFGHWPSFHDAEVISLSLSRQKADSLGPVLVAEIHVFEMTREVSESGHFVCRNHSVVELQFNAVEGLELDGFNHQNALDGISISESSTPGRLAIVLEPAYGLGAAFTCSSVDVLSAVPAFLLPASIIASKPNYVFKPTAGDGLQHSDCCRPAAA